MNNMILKQRIMRRVHTIHLLRKVISPFTLKCAVLMAFIIGTVSFVSAQSIVANMPHTFDMAAIFYFSKYAFLNTEFLIQTLILGTLTASVWIASDVLRTLSFTPERRVAHL